MRRHLECTCSTDSLNKQMVLLLMAQVIKKIIETLRGMRGSTEFMPLGTLAYIARRLGRLGLSGSRKDIILPTAALEKWSLVFGSIKIDNLM